MKCEKIIGLLMAVAVMLISCANDDEYVAQDGPVSVELAYAFYSPSTSGLTRQASEVVTDATTPRLPYFMRLIPLINAAPQLGDISWEDPVSKESPNSRFYRSRYCSLDIGVNGLLVYGGVVNKAVPEGKNANLKMYNGSLLETFPSTITHVTDVQDGISFSLEPIYKASEHGENGIPSGAQTLADYMTAIATTVIGEETEKFYNSTDGTISGFFEKFSNESKPLPGSAASVKVWIEKFIETIQPTIDDGNTADDIETKLTKIKNAASAQITSIGDITATTYPRSINLPDGVAALRWVESENAFKPQMYTTTLDDINTVSRFAYPASLYYFVNSGINTSTEVVDYKAIYANANTAWEHVLDHFTDGPIVEGTTRSVALTNPVQYAVGQLQVKVQASSETLKDNNDMDVTLDTNFPLKGIIVGGQRPVDYEFKQTENTDTKVKFLYDSQVETCTLSTSSQLGCQTLVLQSYDGEDVDIVLEFENDNENLTFTGVNGCRVYPHTRFYLIGKIPAIPVQDIVDDKDKRVFTKDYITTVNLTVASLKKAYNVLPSLLTGHLELGIEVSDWMAATPDVVILK